MVLKRSKRGLNTGASLSNVKTKSKSVTVPVRRDGQYLNYKDGIMTCNGPTILLKGPITGLNQGNTNVPLSLGKQKRWEIAEDIHEEIQDSCLERDMVVTTSGTFPNQDKVTKVQGGVPKTMAGNYASLRGQEELDLPVSVHIVNNEADTGWTHGKYRTPNTSSRPLTSHRAGKTHPSIQDYDDDDDSTEDDSSLMSTSLCQFHDKPSHDFSILDFLNAADVHPNPLANHTVRKMPSNRPVHRLSRCESVKQSFNPQSTVMDVAPTELVDLTDQLPIIPPTLVALSFQPPLANRLPFLRRNIFLQQRYVRRDQAKPKDPYHTFILVLEEAFPDENEYLLSYRVPAAAFKDIPLDEKMWPALASVNKRKVYSSDDIDDMITLFVREHFYSDLRPLPVRDTNDAIVFDNPTLLDFSKDLALNLIPIPLAAELKPPPKVEEDELQSVTSLAPSISGADNDDADDVDGFALLQSMIVESSSSDEAEADDIDIATTSRERFVRYRSTQSVNHTERCCLVCFDDGDDLFRLEACGSGRAHFGCHYCWASHVISSINRGQAAVTCMARDCASAVGMSNVLFFAGYRFFSIARKLVAEQRRLDSEQHLICRFCPKCNFRMATTHPAFVERWLPVTCPSGSCTHVFCFACLEPPHWPLLTCAKAKEYAKMLQQNGDYSLEMIEASTYTAMVKACPKCGVLQDKYVGCDHVHCVSCKFEFCWHCGSAFRGHRCNNNDFGTAKASYRYQHIELRKQVVRNKHYNQAVSARSTWLKGGGKVPHLTALLGNGNLRAKNRFYVSLFQKAPTTDISSIRLRPDLVNVNAKTFKALPMDEHAELSYAVASARAITSQLICKLAMQLHMLRENACAFLYIRPPRGVQHSRATLLIRLVNEAIKTFAWKAQLAVDRADAALHKPRGARKPVIPQSVRDDVFQLVGEAIMEYFERAVFCMRVGNSLSDLVRQHEKEKEVTRFTSL